MIAKVDRKNDVNTLEIKMKYKIGKIGNVSIGDVRCPPLVQDPCLVPMQSLRT